MQSVCLVTPRYPPDIGGVAQAVKRLAMGLKTRGFKVSVVVTETGSMETENQELWQKSFWEKLRQHQSFDIIHAYYLSLTGPLAIQAGDWLDLPVVLSARGNDLDRDIWMMDRFPQLLEAIAKAQVVTGVTTELAQKIKALGKPQAQVFSVFNAVDTRQYFPRSPGPLKSQLGLQENTRLMGFVGEARQKKGLPTLLLTFATLAKTFPDWHLVFLGGIRPGPDQQLFDIFLTQSPQLQDRIHCQKYLPAQDIAYSDLDLFLLPSLQEGMANAMLEAMACGVCVLASDIGGARDVIQHQHSGWLIPAYDQQALQGALERLMNNAALRKALGNAGRQRVAQDFTPERELQAYQQIYQRCCQ